LLPRSKSLPAILSTAQPPLQCGARIPESRRV